MGVNSPAEPFSGSFYKFISWWYICLLRPQKKMEVLVFINPLFLLLAFYSKLSLMEMLTLPMLWRDEEVGWSINHKQEGIRYKLIVNQTFISLNWHSCIKVLSNREEKEKSIIMEKIDLDESSSCNFCLEVIYVFVSRN